MSVSGAHMQWRAYISIPMSKNPMYRSNKTMEKRMNPSLQANHTYSCQILEQLYFIFVNVAVSFESV